MSTMIEEKIEVSNGISNRAMKVALHIGYWTASKNDKSASKAGAEQFQSDPTMLRATKQLIERTALEEVKKIAGHARLLHMQLTLPWDDNGFRVLSSDGYFKYVNAMGKLKAEFESAVLSFLPTYASYVKDAEARLRGLYDSNDYPDVDAIEKKFYFTFDFEPIADSIGDFRCVVDQKVIADEVNKVNQRLNDAMLDLASRVKDTCQKVVMRLRGYGRDANGKVTGKFHDTLISNVEDLASLLPSFNFLNNPGIDKLQDELMELCMYHPDTLRENDSLRENIAVKAEKVVSNVEQYF